MEKEKIVADPKGLTLGTIVESHVDKGSGPVATVIVRNGTLRQGDQIIVGDVLSKVRSMREWHGAEVKEAGPSMPVVVVGFKEVPQVGAVLKGLEGAEEAKRARRVRKSGQVPASMQKVLQSSESKKKGEVTINLMLKADVLGSLEAIQESLDKFDAQGVKISIVGRGLGHITEADVLRADDSDALLLGFRAYPKSDAQELARAKKVILKNYDVIYDLLDYLAEYASSKISPETSREELGELKVLKIFRTENDVIVLGGEVTQGKIVVETKFEWISNGRAQGQGALKELQSGKEEVGEVVEGQQAGIKITNVGEIQPGDILKFYKEKEKKKKVSS
jgi:translation initiation factor IF-2